MKRQVFRHGAGLLLIAGLLHAADDVPAWVREATALTIPSYPTKVSSVVLLQEETVTVDADGHRVMRERGVVKILQTGGETVTAYRTYNVKSGRIRDFQGWQFPPSGKPIPVAKNRVLDIALSREYVYDEARAKFLEFGSAPPGTLFAWEVTEEDKTVFTQGSFAFQQQSPVLLSRFSLTLPQGWESRGIVFNHGKMEPRAAGNTYSWELLNLPWIESEDYSPSLSSLSPRLVWSFYPPEGNRAGLQGLKDWTAVSTWLSTLVDPPADVTAAISAKAAQLTANAASDIDKIRAIAAFVQQTNYVEVALNITRGGGYTPHRAEDSLTKNYGDCKDKATLMRSLLKAAGIESYLTTITSGDRGYVREEWASPSQFNHAIIAVHVSDSVTLPTVIGDSPLGRLLIFDPTDSITPVGDLPESEQGSYALVIAGAKGVLLKMPLLPAAASRVESTVAATLDAEGRLKARLERQYYGQSGKYVRAVQKLRGGEELKRRFERTYSNRLGGTTLGPIATEPHPEDNRLALNLELTAERFGQLAQGKLLIVRPGQLASGGEYAFPSKPRTTPVKLDSAMRRDSIRVKLPAGFKLDELPPSGKLESPYGTLQASWAVRDGEIVMEQTLEVRDVLAPAAEYAKVREFFERVMGAQSAPVVFVKQ